MARIEPLLSARLFLVPQLVDNRIYFMSNLNGRNSLYVMDEGGSVPEPLLPPDVALQNPHLIQGESFKVLPKLGKILLMLDDDGNEAYQPVWIPLEGGYPEPINAELFRQNSCILGMADADKNIAFIITQSLTESMMRTYRLDLETKEALKISESPFGRIPIGINKSYDKFVLADQFGMGDSVLYRYDIGDEEPTHFFGTLPQDREPGQQYINGIGLMEFKADEQGAVFTTVLFDDHFSVAHMAFDQPEPKPVPIEGLLHEGVGELNVVERLPNGRFLLQYNIDGCSWVYEATLDEATWTLTVDYLLVGQGELANGVLESIDYDEASDRFALAFSTATSPTQIYTIEGDRREQLVRHTNERVLGINQSLLSSGEDYSFTSFDGLRISARLYLPSAELGFAGKRPLIYYIHGGPQGQERPDFAWFSMPFIQFLTLNGFAVFVPNVRGSTGYGFSYTNRVVRDWGGQDRLDHVHAMTEILPKDDRLDVSQAGVVGRSYGGYMTLTLAARHPELWQAAIDMFGPYDLLTFASRVPETWKPFIKFLVGDPETEQDFLRERSPRTYIEQVTAPMLVIQGKNDPRVIEQESRELVDMLRNKGKTVDYLMFEDEGHDILKYDNRVTVYTRMTDFFQQHLT